MIMLTKYDALQREGLCLPFAQTWHSFCIHWKGWEEAGY